MYTYEAHSFTVKSGNLHRDVKKKTKFVHVKPL